MKYFDIDLEMSEYIIEVVMYLRLLKRCVCELVNMEVFTASLSIEILNISSF